MEEKFKLIIKWSNCIAIIIINKYTSIKLQTNIRAEEQALNKNSKK